jgi:hypothetical protein
MAQRVSAGAGMVAGLELWRGVDGLLELRDLSADGRFADDVATWSVGLRPVPPKKVKRAPHAKQQPKQNPAPPLPPDAKPRRGRPIRQR